MQRVVLASGSPRRQELLQQLGVAFDTVPSQFDERLVQCEDPVELVEALALQKALEVAKQVGDGVVIGADTVVELDGAVLGKPKHKEEAQWMLTLLSGKKHRVVTGLVVMDALTGEQEVEHVESWVRFRPLTDAMIGKYLESEVWKDKAGAYAIQEDPGKFVEEYAGPYTNIMGLPLVHLADMLERRGVQINVSAIELENWIAGGGE